MYEFIHLRGPLTPTVLKSTAPEAPPCKQRGFPAWRRLEAGAYIFFVFEKLSADISELEKLTVLSLFKLSGAVLRLEYVFLRIGVKL